jgi:hypothetical protein
MHAVERKRKIRPLGELGRGEGGSSGPSGHWACRKELWWFLWNMLSWLEGAK